MMDNAHLHLEIPFPDKRHAEIIYEVLRLDAEPSRSTVKKNLALDNNIVKVDVHGHNAKNLRVAVNALFDNLHLVTQTLDAFGPPSATYDHY